MHIAVQLEYPRPRSAGVDRMPSSAPRCVIAAALVSFLVVPRLPEPASKPLAEGTRRR
jgi:hypothetical protein